MTKLLAKTNISNSADLSRVFRDFDPKAVPLYIKAYDSEVEIGELEIKQDELGIYFVLIPKTPEPDTSESDSGESYESLIPFLS
jgi:hypothetical protein